jgi:hypothetical protein
MDHSSLVEQLDRMRARAVPIIGAGLAVGCGAPSSAELANELAQAAGVEFPESMDLYEVANELERRHGRTWVQECVADITLTRELTPTPVMLAVTLINRRLVATTNYDDAIEEAARRHGLTPERLVPSQLPTVLQGPGQGELFVLHLHGTAHLPETIVLTDETYEAARRDEALQLAVRVLAAGSSLVFLGHRLASNETHLRRDVKQAVELFGGGEHLLLHAEGELSEPAMFESETGVRAMAYPNPDRDHRLLVPFARRLGVPPLSAPHAHVPHVAAPVEAAYEPMPVAPAAEVETDEQRQLWHYRWLYKGENPPTVDDLASSPLLLIGRPGTGKTQALLHIAQRSSNAVYLRLGSVTAPITGQDPVDVLVGWVHSAGGSFHAVPAVTRATLQDNAYDFLLDALDEHPASRRRDLIGAAGAMASAMPQHRWVLASRRVPELTADALVDFDRYELVPTREWMVRYAEQHGVDQAELDDRLRTAPALADLLDVPLFTAATVALVKSGQPIPSSPLDLLLSYASRALDNEETRLGADPVAIDTWLDRLALAMLCAGTDSATNQDVASASLIGELPPGVTSDHLVTRVLLVESGGELRFPIRPIRDARAIRELCRLPHGGRIFERFGVVRLAGQEHLRPDWQYAVDLLASAGQDWLTRVGRVDPLTAARATTVEQGQSERLDAAQIILDWYRSHRIHIPRPSEGQLRDDLEAVRLLVKHSELDALVPDLIQDLADPDPARRGNAVEVLSAVGAVDELEPRLGALLRDGDSVVRRRAAAAIADHGLSSYAAELVDLAIADRDDLSRRTLAEAALHVADDTAVCGLLLRLPTRLRQHIQLTVDHRMTRSQQLVAIASADEVDGEWLQHLAGQEPLDWEAADVEEFSRLWQTAERYQLDTDVLRVLTQHPIDALKAAFNAGASLFDVLPMLEAADPNELDRLAQEVEPDARGVVQDFRALPPRSAGPSKAAPPDPPPFDLALAVADGDLESILANQPSADTISSLSPSARADLDLLVDLAWSDPSTGTSPVLRITRTGRGRWEGSARDFQLVTLVLRMGRSFTQDEWFKAVDLTPHEPDERANLRNAFKPAWEARAIADLPEMDDDVVESLIRALPGPWTRVLAEAVANRAFSTTDQGLHQVAAERIAESGHLDLLTTWATDGAGSAAIDRVLAARGSADAEARLLADFEQRGYPDLKHRGRDSVWINQLSAPTSAKAVETALRTMLRRGVEAHELTPLFRALNRCAGDDAARVYDSMIGDASIPSAPFLWYRKQELIAAQPPELDTVERVSQTIYRGNE